MAMIGNFHLDTQSGNEPMGRILTKTWFGIYSNSFACPSEMCNTQKQKKAVESRKWLARANSSAIEILLIYC